MKILVLGHSVVDKINYGKTELVKPGGIFYAAVVLANISSANDKIYLCTAIEGMSQNLFLPVYKQIEMEYVYYSEKIPEVCLTIYDDKEREETYSSISDNLQFNVGDVKSFDGLLINMISGYDLSLNQLKEIRKKYSGLIYFDVHTFARGFDKNGKRDFRQIQNFNSWAECVDIIQANESEIKTLSSQTKEEEIVKELFDCGIEQFIVTKGGKGVKVYFIKNNSLTSITIPAIKTVTVNKVGCGDVFGAVFFYNYIRNKNLIEALTLANIAAGISTTYTNMNDFVNIKADVLARYN